MGVLILHLLSDGLFGESYFAISSYPWSISLSVGCDYPSERCNSWRAVNISSLVFQMFEVCSMGKFINFEFFLMYILMDVDVYDLVWFF